MGGNNLPLPPPATLSLSLGRGKPLHLYSYADARNSVMTACTIKGTQQRLRGSRLGLRNVCETRLMA